MTTLELTLTLPDDLAQRAKEAGLLSSDAMESMLREWLRRRAGEDLRALWQSTPQEALTPEIEQEIVEEVRQARAERRVKNAG